MSKLKNYATLLALIIGLISISTQTARAGSLFEMMNDLLGNLISTNDNAAGSPACVNNPVVSGGSDNGAGSLRQAVIDACPGSTITFSNTILNTGDAVNKISLVSGPITIDKNLTIQGPGATELEINSNGSRSFQINGGATATISGVTITGGGISNLGNLTLADSVISKSSAFQGGGIYSNGNLTVINSTIESNSSSRNGAGLYLNSGNTTLTNTTVSGNVLYGQYGGGIYNTSRSILTITSSTIVNNKISSSSNIYWGGGIYNEQSGTVNIRNSILAGNDGLFWKDFYGTLTSQGYNLIGTYLEHPSGSTTITGDTTGNIVGTNSNPVKASLAMLTFYGGETSTHALLSDSPAVNAGDPGISMPDQRGAARIGRPDIGAFEVNNSQNGGNFVAVLPDGLTENLYQFMFMNPYERYPGNNNTAPTKYQVTGGALPSGFALQVIDPTFTRYNERVDGYLWIKGLTNTGGDFNFTITATDNGRSFVTDYSLRILVEPPPPGECIVNPVVIHTANNGAGSLRRAVRDACPDSTITFRDNLSGVILIKSGPIAINKNLTIQGPGAGRLTLQKSKAFEGEGPADPEVTGPPALSINGGVTAAISRLSITGINYFGPETKGIENYGNLTLSDTNITFFATGVSNHSNLNINKSIITRHYRGGILQIGASLTINDTEISSNSNITSSGGGISCRGGALNINNSNISKNAAGRGSGGGLFIDSNCNAAVTNTTISHNVQIGTSITDGGGGIRVTSGTLTVTNSTIVNNISSTNRASTHLGNYGGGIGNGSITTFDAGIVSVRNSIIAGNISQGEVPSDRTDHGPDFNGPMISQGYNLIGNSKDATITGDTTGNIVGTNGNPINPQITPYGFHGGSTRIHALFSNSPAVNAGDPGLSTPDQRGAARVGRADIGAFELNNAASGGSFVAVLPDGSPHNYYEYKLVNYDIYARIHVTGSYDTTTYELTSGALPPGITLTTTPPVYDGTVLLSPGFVVLSGTTNASGIYNFSITATDGGSSTVTDYSVRFGTLTPNPTPTITPTPTVTPTPTPTPPSPYGSFDSADCSAISGWAWDPQQPNTPISVNIYADDNLVATVSADQFRQDLLDAGIGNGVHSFSLATPESLKDGQPHQIRVQIVSTSSEIDNSPQSFTCESPTPTPTPTPTATPTPSPTPNTPPNAANDVYNVDEDSTLNTPAPGVLGNDTDGENDALTAVLQTSPAHAAAFNLNANGSFTYTPRANFFGTDSFTYTATDGIFLSDAATVSITVNPVNDAPAANGGSITTDEDTTSSPFQLTGTDADNDSLTFEIVTAPVKGNYNSTTGVYMPNANANGSDSFTFIAKDAGSQSSAATVLITINPVNDAPTADNQSATTDEDTAKSITLSGGDVDGDALTYLANQPSHGSLSCTAASCVYTPAANYNGADSFTFKTNDGTMDSAAATVSITVNAVNDSPTAFNDSASTDEDTTLNIAAPGVLGNDSDPDNDSLTTLIVSSTANGTLNLNSNGSFSYTPNVNFNGSDSFTYKANDGSLDSNTVTVLITVNAVNDAPTILSGTIGRQQSAGFANSQIAAVADIENAANTLTVTVTPLSGSGVSVSNIAIDANGVVTADVAASCGATNSSFTLTVSDGNLSATATLNVAVTTETTPPVIDSTSYANITVNLPAGSTSMAVNFPTPIASDNCGAVMVTTNPAADSLFPLGTTTVTITATDASGNQSTATFTVSVVYNFSGFSSPISGTSINSANAGGSIPVKFSLSGYRGAAVINSAVSNQIPCPSGGGTTGDVIPTTTAGNSGLSYDAATDTYTYVWKTEKGWKNTCRRLAVTLTDGTTHKADFQFK